MSRDSLYHDFFYNPDARGEYAGCTWWFREDRFFSYSTVIGMRIIGRDGRGGVLLISSNSMSPTTAKHISNLRMACPYMDSRIISVPFHYGERPVDQAAVLQLFLHSLRGYSPDDMRYAHHRREYLALWDNLQRFSELCHKVPASILREFGALAKVAQMETDRKSMLAEISGLTAKRDAVKKRKEARERRERLKLLEGVRDWSYMQMVAAAFGRDGAFMDAPLRAAIREKLDSSRLFSFCWWDSAERKIRTSQGIRMEISEVVLLLKRWRAGRVHAGQHIGPYEIREITSEYVQIGCHRILMENIEALAEELLDKEHKASA